MAELPTLYQHYTSGGIHAGLSANQPYFTLNDRNITIFSGAMHYFRVPQEHWRDRLRKMRAGGLNAVETYVPWNLHEPQPGVYDFGSGGSDFQELLNIEKFLKTAQEEDLLAIVRPGPYICSEWEYGGLPSWLLREQGVRVRTSDSKFMEPVERYFKVLFAILTALQFTRGGPIIAFQIENEYGSVNNNDFDYLMSLKETFLNNGVSELLFTSDMPSMGKTGMIPGVLYTANFQGNAANELRIRDQYQPNTASMVMEYWAGWFDHWTEKHHTKTVRDIRAVMNDIFKFPSSINIYMYHGGTNWGFMNGANIRDTSSDNAGYQPDTSSYDYDAPLTEAGDYTSKYYAIRDLIETYNTVPTKIPQEPSLIPRIAFDDVKIVGQLSLAEALQQVDQHFYGNYPVPMELLPINNNAGQSYGYIVYRKKNLLIEPNSQLTIHGRICDTAMVLINGELKSKVLETQKDLEGFGYWRTKNGVLDLGDEEYREATLEIVVENWGRNNFGQLNQFVQYKGLWQGNVSINGIDLVGWEIIPVEFKKNWTNNLKNWKEPESVTGPTLYKGILNVQNKQDTYIDMRNWNKGIVIVNGFVLSRYLRIGPQQAAYLPGPFLKIGDNEIVIFEHFNSNNTIKFLTNQVFETLP